MAGKIIADTLEHSTAGSIATNYVVEGSAKAWANFNGTGTVAIRDSLNVSSLTDNGTGDYTVVFTAAMANLNYAVPTGFSGDGVNNFHTVLATPLAGSARMYAIQWGIAFYDTPSYSVSILGDLA